MSKVAKSYRELCRNVGRLPLDNKSLSILRQKVRDEFRSGKDVHRFAGVNPKPFHSFLSLMNDILMFRKYKRVADLLDVIYKPNHNLPEWITEFCSYKYSMWKDTWPQIHLLNEFGNEKSKTIYKEQLKAMEPKTEFLLMEELNLTLPKNETILTPLLMLSEESDKKTDLLGRVQKLHSFIFENADILLDLKVLPLEVYYEPTRLGLPLSVAARENKLKKKLNYIKTLVRSFRPLEEESIIHLINVSSANDMGFETSINPNFYRFMLRHNKGKLENTSPFEKKYVWQKTLIPDARNIRSYYKQYAMKQFYIDNAGDYRVSPAKNYYD